MRTTCILKAADISRENNTMTIIKLAKFSAHPTSSVENSIWDECYIFVQSFPVN